MVTKHAVFGSSTGVVTAYLVALTERSLVGVPFLSISEAFLFTEPEVDRLLAYPFTDLKADLTEI